MLRRLARLLAGLDCPDPDLQTVNRGVLARLAATESRLDRLQALTEATREDIPEASKLDARLGSLERLQKELTKDVAHDIDRLETSVREIRGRQTGGNRRNIASPEAVQALQALEAARSGDPTELQRLLGIEADAREPEPV